MARHRFLLGAIALSIGFCLGLLFEQNLQAAIVTGLITLPATLGADALTDYLRGYRTRSALTVLKARTRSMQRRGAKIYELLVAVNEERQRAIASLNSLQAQLKPLQQQVLERWEQSEELAWRLKQMQTQKQELSAQSHQLQTQIRVQEQQMLGLQQAIAKLASEREQAEGFVQPLKANLRQLHNELKAARSQRDQLVEEIQDWQQQKQQLGSAHPPHKPAEPSQEIQVLQNQNHQLKTQIQQLQVQVQQLEQRPPHPLQEVAKQMQVQVTSLRQELDQLEARILQRRAEKVQLEEELATLREPKAPSPTPVVATLSSPSAPPGADLPEEWTEFMVQLSSHEFQALKAIATQSNPAATLKQIAEAQVTMPELLIDAINERAVDTVGDVVVEPGSVPVAIASEHQALVQQVVATYEYLTR